MKRISSSKILLGALAISLVATSISAYVILKPRRTWKKPPTVIVDNSGQASIDDPGGQKDHGRDETIMAINSAWNGAVAGVVNAVPGPVDGVWALGDGTPMLSFEDPSGACTGNCLAATFTGFFTVGRGPKRIVDADIVTNANFQWTSETEPDGCSDEFFIEGVHVHEVGHVLGFDHSNVSGATMFPSVSLCNNGPADLSQDDIDGILDLYGDGDGGNGGGCELAPKGASCNINDDCCSGKCRGPSNNKSCK